MPKISSELKPQDAYYQAFQHGSRLSLSDRIRLCVALLEPDCTHPMGRMNKAVELLRSLL
jgi:hypothetical protein